MNDVAIYAGIMLSELLAAHRIEIHLDYKKLIYLKQRSELDSALLKALDMQLVEIVVSDDYDKGEKTLIIYPFGESPPEDEWRLIRHETPGKSQRTQSSKTSHRLLETGELGD